MRTLTFSRSGTYARILSNSSWNALQQIVTLGANSVIGILLVVALPINEFGLYSYAVALCSIGIAVMTAGLSGLAVKAFVDDPTQSDRTMATLVIVRELFALLGYGFIALMSLSSGSDLAVPAVLLASLALFGRALDAPEFWYLSRLQSRRTASIRILVSLFLLLFRIGALWLFPNVWFFLAVFALESIIVGILILLRYRSEQESPGFARPTRESTGTILRQSFPLMLSGIAGQVNLKGDVAIIQLLLGSTAVGVYAAAARLSELAYFMPAVAMNSLFPTLLNARRDHGADNERYKDVWQRSYDAAFWLGVLVAGGVFFFGIILITQFFGPEYADSKTVLAIHVITCPFIFMAAVYSKWIIAEDILWASVLRHGLGAVANILLCFLLIPPYGVKGAAFATLTSYIIASYLSCFVGGNKTREAGVSMTLAILAPIRYARAYRQT